MFRDITNYIAVLTLMVPSMEPVYSFVPVVSWARLLTSESPCSFELDFTLCPLSSIHMFMVPPWSTLTTCQQRDTLRSSRGLVVRIHNVLSAGRGFKSQKSQGWWQEERHISIFS